MVKIRLLGLLVFCLACTSDQIPSPAPTTIVIPAESEQTPTTDFQKELQKPGVHWYEMNAHAFLKAQRERRPIMLYLHDDSCEPCVVMERATLNDPEIAARLNTEFIPVIVSDEIKKEVEKASGKLIFPSVVFLSPDGEHLLTINGFIPPFKFKFVLEAISTAVQQTHPPVKAIFL